jgi:hypothetical protein
VVLDVKREEEEEYVVWICRWLLMKLWLLVELVAVTFGSECERVEWGKRVTAAEGMGG